MLGKQTLCQLSYSRSGGRHRSKRPAENVIRPREQRGLAPPRRSASRPSPSLFTRMSTLRTPTMSPERISAFNASSRWRTGAPDRIRTRGHHHLRQGPDPAAAVVIAGSGRYRVSRAFMASCASCSPSRARPRSAFDGWVSPARIFGPRAVADSRPPRPWSGFTRTPRCCSARSRSRAPGCATCRRAW